MGMIMDYRVVQSSGTHAEDVVNEVAKEVRNYIHQGGGWKPTGGISVIYENGFYTAFQALFKG